MRLIIMMSLSKTVRAVCGSLGREGDDVDNV